MKNILLLITGSVAIVRVPQIVEELAKHHEIKIARTSSSEYFWKKEWDEQFGSLGIEIFTDQDEWSGEKYTRDMPVAHIELGNWADVVVIAPLTANTLAKIAGGLADNLVTCVMRAWPTEKPVIMAPAMNTRMWEHPVTSEQLKRLKGWYKHSSIVSPVTKRLACGEIGRGGIADTKTIVSKLFKYLCLNTTPRSN